MSDVTPYKWKNRVKESNNFLYEIQYDDYEQPDLNGVDNAPVIRGGCSAAHVGNFFGRNLDLGFNEDVSFVIRCSKVGCKKSIGMAVKPGLTRAIVKGGEVVDDYNVLPFYTMDGINEDGLVISTHVVPKVNGLTKAAKGRTVGSKQQIKSLWFPRYVLDNCSTTAQVQTALNNLVLTMETATAGDYNHHFLIADKNGNTICVEFHNPNSNGVGNIYVHNVSAHPWLTNFHITRSDNYTKIGLKSDKSLPSPFTEIENPSDVPSNYGVEPVCNGLERWNALAKQCTNSSGSVLTSMHEETMIYVMNSVYYSNAYKSYSSIEERWCSEFLGIDGVPTVDVPQSDERWKGVLKEVNQAWSMRQRNNNVWHTVYSTVYDIEKNSFKITIQEGSDSCKKFAEDFQLNKDYRKKEAPTVAYKNDFVFDKDLYVQGRLYIGNTYDYITPIQYTDRKSNGFGVAQLPINYLENIDGNISLIESQLCAVHEGSSYSESCDGAGQDVYLVLFSVPFTQLQGDYARPYDAQGYKYIATSLNPVNQPEAAYGNDTVVQWKFNPFHYNLEQDGILRIAMFNAQMIGHYPRRDESDVRSIRYGTSGHEPLRLRRAAYSWNEDGSVDVDGMVSNGVRFWSGAGQGENAEWQPRIPSGSTGSDPIVGMPLFKVYYTHAADNIYEVTDRFMNIEQSMSTFINKKETFDAIVKHWEENGPW